MKNGKLFLLLALLLSLSVFLFACGEDTGEDETDTGTAAPEQVEPTPEVKHELYDYFVLDPGTSALDFSKVAQYKGEFVDLDQEHHLLALETKDLDALNQVIHTVTVYDLLSGEAIQQHEVKYPLNAPPKEMVQMDVKISYPVICVEKTSYGEDGETQYTAEFYTARKDGVLLHSAAKGRFDPDQEPTDRIDYGNGLVAFHMGDRYVWIDRNGDVVHTIDAVASNGYDIQVFNSEYQGYLYVLEDELVQIFNREGVCSGEYSLAHKGLLNAHVLDNGNVLIQDLTEVDAFTSCDLKLDHVRYQLKSYVMNYVNGALTEVKLDYLVDSLETAYSHKYEDNHTYNYLDFDLAPGRDNQAIIFRISAGELSNFQEYVVLSNDLQIQYTLKNTTPGADLSRIEVISEELYVASVQEGGYRQKYIFDLDGTQLAAVSNNNLYVTASYIVTDFGVYDHKMTLLYDLSTGEFAEGLQAVDETNDRIYVGKHNFETGGDEVYLLDVASKQGSLVADGVDTRFGNAADGYYSLVDDKTGNTTYYNLANEKKLVIHHIRDIKEMDHALMIEAEFNGDPVVFVVQ